MIDSQGCHHLKLQWRAESFESEFTSFVQNKPHLEKVLVQLKSKLKLTSQKALFLANFTLMQDVMRGTKVAILTENTCSGLVFLETYLINRGMFIRQFSSTKEAEDWLG